MRVSSYNIYVKLRHNPLYYFLVHGYTGAVDLISAKVIKSLREEDFSSISISTIESLKRRGYITSKTKDDEIEHLKFLSNRIRNRKSGKKNHLYLLSHKIVTSVVRIVLRMSCRDLVRVRVNLYSLKVWLIKLLRQLR